MTKVYKALSNDCEWCGRVKVMAGLEVGQGDKGCSLTMTWKCPDDSCRGRQAMILRAAEEASEESFQKGVESVIEGVLLFMEGVTDAKSRDLLQTLLLWLRGKYPHKYTTIQVPSNISETVTAETDIDPKKDPWVKEVILVLKTALKSPNAKYLGLTKDGTHNLLDTVEDFLVEHYKLAFKDQED